MKRSWKPLLLVCWLLWSVYAAASTAPPPFALPTGAKATPVPLREDELKSPLAVSLPRRDGNLSADPFRLKVRGDRQRFILSLKGSPSNLKRFAAAVGKDHWSVLSGPGEQRSLVARKFQPYGETWLLARADKAHIVVDLVARRIDPADLKPPEDSDFDLIGRRLVTPLGLVAPSSDRASVDKMDDFPFLSHFPGMELQVGQSRRSEMPMEIQERVEGRGYQYVSLPPPVITRVYSQPFPIQPIRLFNAYDRALRAVGWRTVDLDPGDMSGKPYLIMNFSGEGRNVWLKLEFETGLMRATVAEGAPIPR